MLTYNFANIGSDSLYEYLYKCIKNDILLGNIRPGEKLPSKRTFAKNLGISVITVENAYAQLVAEGYLYSMPKRGFYAADLEIEDSMRDAVPKEILQVANGETSYFADFSSNQTDSEIFPFTIWTRTVRAVLNDNRIQLMINSPCAGILKLRSAIAKYLREFRGMQVLPEQIIVGAGTEYLHNLLIQLLGNDLVYGVEDPGYHKIARIYESMKVRYEPVPLDQDGVSVQELEKRSVDIIHTSPSHHFPTGTVMPVSRRYELLGWAAKSDHHYIIEDDYDSELRLGGKPFPTLQSIDVSDKVIYMNTFTKTLASTVRISYMVLPQNYYQNKRDLILQAFEKKPLGDYVTIEEEEAGVHFLMHLCTDQKEEKIVTQAKSRGVKLKPLSGYYADTAEAAKQENTYVMNYSSIDPAAMERAAGVLLHILQIPGR